MTIDCKIHLRSGSTKEARAIQDKQAMVVYMLHAGRCLKREETLPSRCTRVECSETKELLLHLRDCNQKRNCDYPKCTEMWKIALHWRNCGHRECAVCGPIVNGMRKLRRQHEKRESEMVDVETIDQQEQSMIQKLFEQNKIHIDNMMAKINDMENEASALTQNEFNTLNDTVDENNNFMGDEAMEVGY